MRDLFGNLIKQDFLGRKIPKKQIKREVLAENRARGRVGEQSARARLELQGWEVTRSPKGKDFVARKRDFLTGKVIQTKHVEVKTGRAKLSKLQKKTKKGKGNYQVMREEPLFW